MALLHYLWSRTAASNSNSDSSVNWAEGQSPSSVNDSARAMMASAAGFRDDIAGAIVTGGTSTAYTVTSYQIFDTLAHMSGQLIAFTPHATNGATVTLNVDGLGAKPLRSSTGVELLAGTLIAGTPYTALYNNSDAVWYLSNFYGNPYNVPLGSGLPFFASTAPNSSFVFPYGQAISRTTYATLFTIFSTQYGTGDGSTTFNVPDLRGRGLAGVDNMGGSAASRLTSSYFGTSASTLGAVGGSESKTLSTTHLPAYTPSGSVSVSAGTLGASMPARAYDPNGGTDNTHLSAGSNLGADIGTFSATISGAPAGSFTGNAQGGVSTPFNIVQPTMVCNFILRVI